MDFKDYSTKESRMGKAVSVYVWVAGIILVLLIGSMMLGFWGPIVG